MEVGRGVLQTSKQASKQKRKAVVFKTSDPRSWKVQIRCRPLSTSSTGRVEEEKEGKEIKEERSKTKNNNNKEEEEMDETKNTNKKRSRGSYLLSEITVE